MIRPDDVLHELATNEWTEEEIFSHLSKTFDDACRDFPELMEPYAARLADMSDHDEAKSLMRGGLRETFNQRFPNRITKAVVEQAAE